MGHTHLQNPRAVIPIILFVALALLPFVTYMLDATFYTTLVGRFLIYAIAASALNLVLGYAGLVSFGHALFFGLGVYGVAICSWYGVDSGLAQLFVGVMLSAVIAFVTGAVCLRTRGIAFIMITLAFAQMGYYLFVSLPQFGGSIGMPISHTSRFMGANLSEPYALYGFAFIGLAALTWWSAKLRKSPFGMVLRGSTQNDQRTLSLGFPVFRYQLAAYVISAAITSVAGFLLANLTAYASPSTMEWTVSGDLIVMIVLGGMGTVFGPVYGALAFLILEEVLQGYTDHWAAVLGVVILLIAIFWQRGLSGIFEWKPFTNNAGSPTPLHINKGEGR